MITVNSVVSRIIRHKTCSTVIVTNYEKCSVKLLELISSISFVTNTTTHYPDFVFVVPNEVLSELRAALMEECSWIQMR